MKAAVRGRPLPAHPVPEGRADEVSAHPEPPGQAFSAPTFCVSQFGDRGVTFVWRRGFRWYLENRQMHYWEK